MGNITAIYSLKGGTAKTVSAVSISAALVKFHKKRCLLVDLDPQHSASIALNVTSEKTVFDAVVNQEQINPVEVAGVPGLDMLPADIQLITASMLLAPAVKREYRVSKALEPYLDRYDHIIIDCSPSMDILTVSGLISADHILTPISTGTLSLKGFTILNNLIQEIDREITGVFITMYQETRLIDRGVFDAVQANFQDRLFKTRIRRATVIDHALANQINLFDFKPARNSGIVQDYKALTKEYLKRFSK